MQLDWRGQHAAVRNAAGLLDCTEHGRLHATGPDMAQVLHAVVTNEVKNLPPGMGCLAAVLNDVGRTQTLLVILRTGDDFLIETPPGLAEKSRALIDYYIITEDAAIEDESAEWGQLSVQGPLAREILTGLVDGALPLVGQPEYTHVAATIHGQLARIVRRTRTGEDGYDVWVSNASYAPVWSRVESVVNDAGGTVLGAQALEVLRVEASIPRFGVDLDETTIPLEAGLTQAISENKGCYLGQEVIARIINLSRPVRTLVGLLPESDACKGDRLFTDGKEVGRVTSAVDSPTIGRRLALAYVRTDLLARGVHEVVVNGAVARIHPGPFYRSELAPVAVVPPSPVIARRVPGLDL